jgi:hypothetical protein
LLNLDPLPRGITTHKLCHTFASVLVAIGRDSRDVMAQLGHEDPRFTMRRYSHALRLSDHERDRLCEFVEGREWARTAANEPRGDSEPAQTVASDPAETSV